MITNAFLPAKQTKKSAMVIRQGKLYHLKLQASIQPQLCTDKTARISSLILTKLKKVDYINIIVPFFMRKLKGLLK